MAPMLNDDHRLLIQPPSNNLCITKHQQQVCSQVTVRGNTSCLFVSNVSAADFGEYVCRANNSIGLSSASIVVVGMYNQICKKCLAMF